MVSPNHTFESVCAALFAKGRACAQIELAELSGLDEDALNNTVERMLDENILIAAREKGGMVETLSFAPNLVLAGLVFDRHRMEAELWFPASGERVRVYGNDTGPDPTPCAVTLLKEALAKAPGANIASLGVAFPGFVDIGNGRIASSAHFPEFNDRPLADEFVEALGWKVPVFIEQAAVCDMTHATVFSKWDTKNAVLVSLRTDVSAVALLDRQILYGKTGNLGGLGHLNLPGGDIPCVCGKTGCLETVVGRLAWERGYKRLRPKESGLPQSLDKALEKGTLAAVNLVLDSLDALTPILRNTITILNPERVFLASDLPAEVAEAAATLLAERLKNSELGLSLQEVVPLESTSTIDGAAEIGACWLSGHPRYHENARKPRDADSPC